MARAKGTDRQANGVMMPAWVTKAMGKRKMRRAEMDFAPFWDPKKDKTHPREIYGVVSNQRQLPQTNKKYEVRDGFDVTNPDTGEVWCVSIKGSLKAQKAKDLKPGTFVAIEYLGERPAKKKGESPMQLFQMYVESND